jgi:Ni/Co efflux regulator RcnB
MNKLLTVIAAAMFAAVSASAFAASHTGAPMKDDKKAAATKKTDAKKAAPKKAEAKKTEKKADKKADKK